MHRSLLVALVAVSVLALIALGAVESALCTFSTLLPRVLRALHP